MLQNELLLDEHPSHQTFLLPLEAGVEGHNLSSWPSQMQVENMLWLHQIRMQKKINLEVVVEVKRKNHQAYPLAFVEVVFGVVVDEKNLV
jgi:hypothetical protein